MHRLTLLLAMGLAFPAAAQHARLETVTRVNYHGAVSPDGEWVAYYSLRGIRIAPTRRRRGPVVASPEPGACATLVWSPDSSRVAWVAAEGIEVWTRGEGVQRVRAFHRGHFGSSFRCSLAFDAHGRLLYVSPTEESELANAQSSRTPLVMAIFREGRVEPVAFVPLANYGFGPPETSPRLASRRVPHAYTWNGRSTGGTYRTHGEQWFRRVDLADGTVTELARGERWSVPENPVGPDGRACIHHDDTVACVSPGATDLIDLPLSDGVTSLRVESRPHRSPFSPSGARIVLHATVGQRIFLAVHDFTEGRTELLGERAFVDRDWQTDVLLMLSEPLDRARQPGLVRLNVQTRERRALAPTRVELVRPIFVPGRTDLFYIGRERESTRDLVQARIRE